MKINFFPPVPPLIAHFTRYIASIIIIDTPGKDLGQMFMKTIFVVN